MKLSDYEFYGTPSGDVMLSSNDHPLKVYEVADREFTQAMLEKIGEFYPDAFSSWQSTMRRVRPTGDILNTLLCTVSSGAISMCTTPVPMLTLMDASASNMYHARSGVNASCVVLFVRPASTANYRKGNCRS